MVLGVSFVIMHIINSALVLSTGGVDFLLNQEYHWRQSVESTDKLVRCIIPVGLQRCVSKYVAGHSVGFSL